MARYMNTESDVLYRVVVVGKTGHKTIYGPYDLARTAGFVKSYMTNDPWGYKHVQDSWIETSEPTWERHG